MLQGWLGRAIVVVAQVALLSAIAVGSDWLSRRLDLPLPGNVVGALLLLGLLSLGAVKLTWVERGGDFLLKHLSLFFVPAAVGVLRHRSTLRASMVELTIVVVVTTAIALLATGLAAERLSRAEGSNSDDEEREP